MSDRGELVAAFGAPRSTFDGSATYDLWVCAPGIILQRVEGNADVDVAREIEARLDRCLAEFGEIVVFDDFAELHSYTSKARLELTEWTRARRAVIGGIHILVASKIVAMGVTVASLVVPQVHSYTNRARFDAALRAAISEASLERHRAPAAADSARTDPRQRP